MSKSTTIEEMMELLGRYPEGYFYTYYRETEVEIRYADRDDDLSAKGWGWRRGKDGQYTLFTSEEAVKLLQHDLEVDLLHFHAELLATAMGTAVYLEMRQNDIRLTIGEAVYEEGMKRWAEFTAGLSAAIETHTEAAAKPKLSLVTEDRGETDA